MAWVPIAIAVASTIFSSMAAKKQGEQQQQAANYNADQLDQNAGQQQAASQRAAAEQRRQSAFAQSRALAVAAASGASASDPSVVDIIGNLNAEGAYRSMAELYQGDDRARILHQQASSARYSGQVAAQAGDVNASASILKGASSLFTKYSSGSSSGGGLAGGYN